MSCFGSNTGASVFGKTCETPFQRNKFIRKKDPFKSPLRIENNPRNSTALSKSVNAFNEPTSNRLNGHVLVYEKSKSNTALKTFLVDNPQRPVEDNGQGRHFWITCSYNSTSNATLNKNQDNSIRRNTDNRPGYESQTISRNKLIESSNSLFMKKPRTNNKLNTNKRIPSIDEDQEMSIPTNRDSVATVGKNTLTRFSVHSSNPKRKFKILNE